MTINQDLLLDIHQLRVQLRERTMTPTEAITKLTQLLVDHPHGMDLVPSLRALNERLIGELDIWLGSLENQNIDLVLNCFQRQENKRARRRRE